MNTIRLGRTGLEVSRICFGCMSFGKVTEERPWVLGLDEARPLFRRAWEAGINFFDTANVYAQGTSEEITGTLIKELAPRDDVVLATKVSLPATGQVAVRGSTAPPRRSSPMSREAWPRNSFRSAYASTGWPPE